MFTLRNKKYAKRCISLLLCACMLLSMLAAFAATNPNAFTRGRDNNSFSHSKASFFNAGETYKYYISRQNLQKLLGLCKTQNERKKIIARVDRTWGGSCYGIACAMAMLKTQQFSANEYQAGASCFYNYVQPRSNKAVRDLVNYYLLSWDVQASRAVDARAYFDRVQANNKSKVKYFLDMARYAQNTGNPFVLSYWSKEDGKDKLRAHAILGVGYGETANYYRIKLYDMNFRDQYLYFWISKAYYEECGIRPATRSEVMMTKTDVNQRLYGVFKFISVGSPSRYFSVLGKPAATGLTWPVTLDSAPMDLDAYEEPADEALGEVLTVELPENDIEPTEEPSIESPVTPQNNLLGGEQETSTWTNITEEPDLPDKDPVVLDGTEAVLELDVSNGPTNVSAFYSEDEKTTDPRDFLLEIDTDGGYVDDDGKIKLAEYVLDDSANYCDYYIGDTAGGETPYSYQIQPVDSNTSMTIDCTYTRGDDRFSYLYANNAAYAFVADDLLSCAMALDGAKDLEYYAYLTASGTDTSMLDMLSVQGDNCSYFRVIYEDDGSVTLLSDNMRGVTLTSYLEADEKKLTFNTSAIQVHVCQFPEDGKNVLRAYAVDANGNETLLGKTAAVKQQTAEKKATPTNVPQNTSSDSGSSGVLQIVAQDPSVSRAAANMKSVTTSNIDVIYQSKDTLVVKAAGDETSLKIGESYDWAYLRQSGISQLTFETGGVKATISTERTGALDMTVKNAGGVLTLESPDSALTATLGIDVGTSRVTPAKLRLLTLVNGEWVDTGKTLTVQKWGERYIVNTPPVTPGSYKLEILA